MEETGVWKRRKKGCSSDEKAFNSKKCSDIRGDSDWNLGAPLSDQ